MVSWYSDCDSDTKTDEMWIDDSDLDYKTTAIAIYANDFSSSIIHQLNIEQLFK